RNGKYLYFFSSPNAGTSEFSWGVLNGVFANPLVVRRVHAVILSNDYVSPLLPNGQPNPEAKVSESAPQVKIDFEGLRSRFINLPLPPRDYSQLAIGRPGNLILTNREWTGDPGGPASQSVYSIDIAKGGPPQKILDQINSVDVT